VRAQVVGFAIAAGLAVGALLFWNLYVLSFSLLPWHDDTPSINKVLNTTHGWGPLFLLLSFALCCYVAYKVARFLIPKPAHHKRMPYVGPVPIEGGDDE
jgi:hypothetical protein